MIALERRGDRGTVMAETSKYAVRPRQRVMSRLRDDGEIWDASGMASTILADAVGYEGSSAAFAQLLSGMERAGLIEREIRGKRTYRIRLAGSGDSPGGADVTAADVTAPGVPAGGVTAGFDYDELARRLLAEVVRRLADGPARTASAAGTAGLAKTVASLERKLTAVQARQQKLTAENARLRDHLSAAQQSLAQARERASERPGRLEAAEVQLLQRLLSSLGAQPGQPGNADVG
jgi:hypothetical protein